MHIKIFPAVFGELLSKLNTPKNNLSEHFFGMVLLTGSKIPAARGSVIRYQRFFVYQTQVQTDLFCIRILHCYMQYRNV